jgi:hypothetical protein
LISILPGLIAFYSCALIIIIRGVRGKLLSQFPLFYSYILYMFVSGAVCLTLYLTANVHFNRAVWFRVLLSFVAEFAILIEISDHIFSPYLLLRKLGRLLAVGLCAGFSIFYILPPILQSRPWDIAVLSFAQETAIAKATILVAILIAARCFRLPLGKNVAGLIVGFSFYLTVSMVTYTAALHFGQKLFEQLLSILVPWSHDLCLLVWAVALWRYEPVTLPKRAPVEGEGDPAKPISVQLGEFNAALMRTIRK